jgi:F-box/leucine-rich repeat protein 10/11
VAQCARVCKSWHKATLDPSLWTVVNLTGQKISAHLLSTTVQKQPVGLLLDWSNMGKQHLNWLLPRIPQTKDLSLVGLEYNMTVSALNTCNCPLLQELNLSFVANLTDAAIHKLLSAPRDSRPGLMDKKSRLKQLRKLSLKNTEVSDVSLRYITQYLPQLSYLAVSGCWKLTDGGMAMLGTPDASSTEQLSGLDVSSCRGLSDSGLQHLQRCKNLTRLDATNTHISTEGLTKFASSSKHRLKCFGSVVDKKPETKRKRK